MNANSFRSQLAILLILVLCAGGAGRPAVDEADDEPHLAAPPAEHSGQEYTGWDESADDEPSNEPVPTPAAEEPEADKPTTADDAEPAMAEPSVVDAEERAEPMPQEASTAEAPEAESEPALLPAESRLSIEMASFKGVQPGTTTRAELEDAWGPAKEIRKSKGLRLQVYVIESFSKVAVTISLDVVSSIVVNLGKPVEAEELAKELRLDDISSVQVTDDNGQLLGEAFPERGVLFGYSPGSEKRLVSQVVLEPIDAQPFLLRAESHLRGHYARCLADADAALQIDPKCAPAHGLRARVYRQAGDLSKALIAARAARRLEPDDSEWRLLLAKILLDMSDFSRVREQAEAVLDDRGADDGAKARAHCLLGDCLAQQSGQGEEAMKHHMEAVKRAEPLAASSRISVRRGAKETLLDAHLGVAVDIGWGRWQQKTEAITKWVNRANTIAQDLMKNEDAEEDVLLRVDQQALAALAGVGEPPDASRWIDNYLRRASRMIEKSPDPARTAQLEWQLGLALCDAVDIEHTREDFNKGLKYGRFAIKHLVAGEAAVRQLPNHDFLLGRAYYKLGVLAAVGKKNHQQALAWYAKAVKLLEKPVPPSHLADPGRQGEIFVSMAVSYWDQASRDEAVRLTRQGAKLMEQAVEDGLLADTALAVPYGNLASMHSELGNEKAAVEFAELAAKYEREKR